MGQLIRQIKKKNGLIRRFAEEEDAVGVVEIILILVVLIGLVIIFKEQLNLAFIILLFWQCLTAV